MWKPINEAQGNSVSRVVLGNVIWLGTSARMERVRSTIQRVVPKYPCRLIMLEYSETETGDTVGAAVNAQCFLPAPGAVPVCCEVIHLSFGSKSAKHVRGCVAPLLLADLQTVLWTALGDVDLPVMKELQAFADRTIRMGSLSLKPGDHLQDSVESAFPTFDLSWFRMAQIREQVAAFFDDNSIEFSLETIRAVRVQVASRSEGGTLPELMGAMVTGWVGSRLGWAPIGAAGGRFRYQSRTGLVDVEIGTCEACNNPSRGNLSSVEMTDEKGRRFSLELGRDGRSMDLWSGPAENPVSERELSLSELDEPEALGMALNAASRLKSFRDAGRLAVPLLQHFSN